MNRWRRLAATKRAGHLGTLDPLATGLLVLVTGTATRLAQFFGKDDKTYVAEVQFGLIFRQLRRGRRHPENRHPAAYRARYRVANAGRV